MASGEISSLSLTRAATSLSLSGEPRRILRPHFPLLDDREAEDAEGEAPTSSFLLYSSQVPRLRPPVEMLLANPFFPYLDVNWSVEDVRVDLQDGLVRRRASASHDTRLRTCPEGKEEKKCVCFGGSWSAFDLIRLCGYPAREGCLPWLESRWVRANSGLGGL